MRFRIMAVGLAAVAVLVVTSVVGATPTTAVRGHAVAAITETTAAADPLDPLTADGFFDANPALDAPGQ